MPDVAKAVAVNLTVTEPDEAGDVTAYPCGTSPPLSSQVNFLPGENRANQTMVGLGGGALCVFVFTSTHLVVDIAGWFGTADGGVPLQPITASRLVDSRNGTGGWNGTIAPGETRAIHPGAGGVLPAGAHDVLLNVVATQAAAPGSSPLSVQAGPAGHVVGELGRQRGHQPGHRAARQRRPGRACTRSSGRTWIDLLGTFGAPGALRDLHVDGLALDPPFRPDIHDYSLHCTSATNNVVLHGDGHARRHPHGGRDRPGHPAGSRPSRPTTPWSSSPGPTSTGPVPAARLPDAHRRKAGTVAPGYYLMENGVAGGAGRFVMILDTNGVPVWYRRVPASIDLKQLPDGNLAWMNFSRANFNIDPANRYEEHRSTARSSARSAPVRAS